MGLIEAIGKPGADKLMRMCVLGLCLTILGGMGVFALWTGKNLDGVSMITVALITVVKDIVGYDWGSSAGSKEKDKLIGELLQGK